MDNLLIKERDKLDKVSRDALEQLMFKDQIIEELRSKLSKEQLENIGMKTKLKEFEDKINFLEEKLEKEENTTFTMQNKFLNTNNNFSDYTNNNNNNNLERINQEQLEFIEKLTAENKDLSARAVAQQAELEIWKEKSKAIAEIEEIYKHQMDQLRKKAENSDLLSKKLKEKESYIEDIISRYNALQNDYEVMINNKDSEIKELKAHLSVLNENNERLVNQVNLLSQNSNNLTQELYKELRLLSDKNKDLELKIVRKEQKYKEEVSNLKKILEESSGNSNSNNLNNNNNNNNNNLNNNDKNELGPLKQDSTSMRVEDLATSLSKSIREKIESQNKKISSQNIEILQLQYELEKIKSDLKYEKELNSKLQSALADLKCKNIQTQSKALFEEAQTQTTLKFDDLESFKIKAKILEDNLIKASEESEVRFKKIEKLKDLNSKLTKECKEKEKEINSLVKKIEKLQLNDRSLERELASVTNISKLNMTVSALKMREAELLERTQNFESEKEKNYNCNYNTNINNNNLHGYYQSNTSNSNYSNYNSNLQNNLNLNYNYAKGGGNHAICSQGFGNNQTNVNLNNQCSECSQNNSFNTTGFNNNNNNNNFIQNPGFYNTPNNNNFNNTFNNNNNNNSGSNNIINSNTVNNNLSSPSFNNNIYNNNQNSQNNQSSAINNTTQNKDLIIEKYELDLKRIQEDSFYLKDQNFRLVSENNKLTEQANSLKAKISECEAEQENLIREKNQLSDNYEKIISSLKEELEKQRSFGNQSIEEMRENLKKIQDTNTKLSDQFNSLQNKFYVQTQLIQEKNLELASEGKIIDSLKKDNEELIENQTKLVEKLKGLEKQNSLNAAEREKTRKELLEAKEKLTDLTLKSNFNKAELEERNKILIDENKNLREINTQLKSKMSEIYEEIKQKDAKLMNVLKEEARELEAKMRQEMSELRLENEQLLKERSAIRLQFNELKYENELLKEQLNVSGQSGVYSPQNLIKNSNNCGANKINVNASNTSAIIQNEGYGSNNLNTGSNFTSSQECNLNNNTNNNHNFNNNNENTNNPNYISYLSAPLVKTSMDAEKIKSAILNQNNTHMQEIIKDNRYLEQENDFIKNENSKLQSELDALSKRFIALENTLKDSKLDFDAVLVEKDKLADSLHKREQEAKDFKLEINLMQNEINKLKEKVIDYTAEINVKNQTINKLLDNLEAEKINRNKKFSEMEETILILKNERNKFEEKSEMLSKQFKAEQEKYKFDLADLRKENEILINDLEKKESEVNVQFEKLSSEISELKNSNVSQGNLIENLTKENSDLKNEKSDLDTQVAELSVLALERLEKQNEKLQKSKEKLEKLVDLYESHIKFLKNKFDSSLHDFVLSVHFKQGALSEKDAEKSKALMKSFENTSELMNQIAGRDALISANKDEIKALKLGLMKAKENSKALAKEKEDLQAVLNVKKLQMKVKEKAVQHKGRSAESKEAPGEAENSGFLSENPLCKNCVQRNLKIETLLRQVTESKVDEREIDIERNCFKAEIKRLEEINKDLGEKHETAQKHIESIRLEQAKKEKELLDAVKLNKSEVSKINEELKKIKEKWVSPEKHAEKVEELESKVKTQKNEITRKNDMINLLKSQLAQAQLGGNNNNTTQLINNTNSLYCTSNNALATGMVNANNNNNNNITSLEEKVKAFQKELNRKDGVIKEFKASLESLRTAEKKLSEENATLTEKNKILKIDVNRKDEIIKDYKDKYNLLTLTQKNQNPSIFEGRSALGGENSAVSLAQQSAENPNSSATAQQTQIKKLKNDIDRKDDIIKTLKAKLENANNEIEQMKTNSIKHSKNNYSELEKEQKRNENLRSKLDSLLMKNENLISIIRRVFKDLILTFEKKAVKSKMNNLDKSSLNYKDGMDILNISADELEEYLNPNADNFNCNSNNKNNLASKANMKNIKNAYDNINSMLDSDVIDSDAFVDLFYSVKEKIFETNSHNNNNNDPEENTFINNNLAKTFSKNNLTKTTPIKNTNAIFNYNSKTNNISNISSINNNTNFTNTGNQKQQSKSIYDNTSFQTPITNDTEPKLKKYQNLLNKVKAGDSSNYNLSFDNINFDGIMNDLQKIKK